MIRLLQIEKDTPRQMAADDQPTFDEWLAQVDVFVQRYKNTSVRHLRRDWFRSMYDSRLRPIYAANCVPNGG